MGKDGEPSDLAKHLASLRGELSAKRTRLHPNTELDELAAISKLAAELWGDGRKMSGPPYGGFVAFDPNIMSAYRMGVWQIGFYLDPPTVFGPQRRMKLMFQGASHAEIWAQVLVWKARRS